MLTRLILCLVLLAGPVSAQSEAEPPMTPERLAAILLAVDPEAAPAGSSMSLTITDIPVLVVFDVAANRMRAMVPVASADGLTEADLMRMMQANFDTALDARYAVANERLWSVYIHPLRELRRGQLLSGLAQTVTLARTYGTLYSGGAQVFGGGDSSGLYRELLDDLQSRGQEL